MWIFSGAKLCGEIRFGLTPIDLIKLARSNVSLAGGTQKGICLPLKSGPVD
jgi:hypothetical protein